MKNKLEFKDSLRKKEKLERKAPDMQISYRLGSRNPLSSPGLGPCREYPRDTSHFSNDSQVGRCFLGSKELGRVPSPGTKDTFIPCLGTAGLQTQVYRE